MNKNETMLGIATYQFNDWNKLLKISDDRDYLEATWEEWNNNLHEYEELLRIKHTPFKEILINLDELVDYCNNQGLLINGESRSEFVARKLKELNLR